MTRVLVVVASSGANFREYMLAAAMALPGIEERVVELRDGFLCLGGTAEAVQAAGEMLGVGAEVAADLLATLAGNAVEKYHQCPGSGAKAGACQRKTLPFTPGRPYTTAEMLCRPCHAVFIAKALTDGGFVSKEVAAATWGRWSDD